MDTLLKPRHTHLLQAMGIDDAATFEDFDVLARVATRVTGALHAFVSFADEAHLWQASNTVPAGQRRPLARTFCSALLAADEDTLVATDVTSDARTSAMAARQADPSVVSYAGALLQADDGRKLGTLCVTDHVARRLDDAQIQLLRGLARQAMNLVSLRAAKRELTEALARMTQLARTDGLTGLLNRKAFHEAAEGLRHASPIGD